MPPIVKNLLLSKKFVVALLTAAGAVAAYLGWNVDPTTVIVAITPLLAFIGAQGWADSGKEKALLEQDTALKLKALSMEHDVNMAVLTAAAGNGANAANAAPMTFSPDRALDAFTDKTRQAVDRVKSGASAPAAPSSTSPSLSVIAPALVFFALGVAAVTAACAHPGQTALRVGQCVLDSGVLDAVLADLEQANYAQLVADLEARTTDPGTITCALQAIATQGGSAAAPRAAAARDGAPDVAARARELLVARRAR